MRTRFMLLAALAASTLAGSSPAAPPPRRASSKPPAPPARAAPRFEWPGDSRAALELPAEAWTEIMSAAGLPGRAPGYSLEEMRNYGRDRGLLRTVETLFHDARAVPRFTGRITDEMLAAADPKALSLGELVRQAYVLTDVSAARFYPGPAADSWGVAWIPPDAPAPIALQLALERSAPASSSRSARKRQDAAIAALPETVQRAIARVLVGADTAAPWLDLAFAGATLPAPSRDVASTQDALYALAIAPWRDEESDQVATRSRASLELLDRVDREYLAYGSVIFLLHAGLGAEELRAWAATGAGRAALAAMSPEPVEIATRFGVVRITGAGDDVHDSPAFLEIDLGGDDRWTGRHGVPAGSRLSLSIDVSGDDTWDGGMAPAAIGCGLFGVGAIIDAAGDDSWRVAESGLGAGWFGTGVVADLAGRDRYVVTKSWGEGAGHAGVGLLVDLQGDDSYECAEQSQGLGSTLGAGVLLDLAGNDSYVARDDGNVSPLYLDQSVAMAQGCGYGRRADLGDGHSIAGGVGVLLDGAGDDHYHAQVWSQGAGYWWSLGILEDRGGNDTYENGKYSAGAGAHFSIGSFVDLAGDDRYNVGVETAVNQYHAHGRDGSIGVAIDGDGDDRYFFRNNAGGSADLGSVALFWDRRGDDEYVVELKDQGEPNGWNETPPMGSATWYPPYRSWRDELPTLGIFLDTGGTDTRPAPAPTPLPSPWGENRTWTRPHDPASHGVGIDAEWYPPATRTPKALEPATSAPR